MDPSRGVGGEQFHDIRADGNARLHIGHHYQTMAPSKPLLSSFAGYDHQTKGELLLKATDEGQLHRVKALLHAGADVDFATKAGTTPLMLAAGKHYSDIVNVLLESGCDINLRDQVGCTAVHRAVYHAKGAQTLEIVKTLVENRACLSTVPEQAETILQTAIQKSDIALLTSLLESGAKPNDTGRGPRAPLMTVVCLGMYSMAKLLLKFGANVDVKTPKGASALIFAVRGGHKDVTELLIENGADVNTTEANQLTPLHLAARSGHLSTIEVLLRNGGHTEARDKYQRTPLIGAARKKQFFAMKLLIDEGADIDATDMNGQTALFHAAEWGSESAMKLLISHGADVHRKDKSGETSLERARRYGHTHLESLLS